MKAITSCAAAVIAAAIAVGPVVASAASPAPNGKITIAQAEKTQKTTPKRTRRGRDYTRQEYLDHAGKRFDRMDANHDGTLTAQERRDYYRKAREERRSHMKSSKQHSKSSEGGASTKGGSAPQQ